MPQSTILILLPQTRYENNGTNQPYDVTGNSVQAAAYYLGNQDLQTVSYSFSEVTGNLVIEATLAQDPVEGDWFKVYEISANNQANTNANLNSYTNLTGNYVKMRAKIKDFEHGVVEFVKVSY
jgi:hypothetical protein